jgi:hypothetical protein
MTRSPLARRSHPVRRRLAASALLLAATGGALAGFAGVASAHTGALSGTATCRTDGTYALTWTLTTTDVPAGDSAAVTEASVAPSSTLTGLPQSVVGNTTAAPVTQSGIPGTATAADLTVDLHWTGTDTHDGTASGAVVLSGTCRAAVTPPTTPPTTTPPIPPSSPVTPVPPSSPVTPTTAPAPPVATTPASAPATGAAPAAPLQTAPAPSAQPCSYTSMTAAECTSPPVVDGVVQGDG